MKLVCKVKARLSEIELLQLEIAIYSILLIILICNHYRDKAMVETSCY